MSAQEALYVVVGLGNPGKGYENTRHNIGFLAADKFAETKGVVFQKKRSFYGLTAEWVSGNKKIILLKPETYMNSSGESVRALVSYYGVLLENLCVVCDEIYLPFGKMRMRASGGSGGHNGLKSISSHLGSELYPRLRIGVGDREEGDLADYVLSPFKEEEKLKIPSLLHQASDALECWLNNGITQAMHCANACLEQKLGE